MSQSHLSLPTQQRIHDNKRGLDIYTPSHPQNVSSDTAPTETMDLTIRFSSSLPDLPLSIPISTANIPTTATLKQHIRASLPQALRANRLRLIHAGKALDDAVPLSTSLIRSSARSFLSVPSRISTPGLDSGSDTDTSRRVDKGKQPVRDPQRIYIHCSIGDVALTDEELATETALAASRDENENRPATTDTATSQAAPTVSVAPRGFDRLLAAGFTASEVHALRLQFVAVQAHTHTPETMPSSEAMRALEDQWLDDSSSGGGGLIGGDQDSAGAGGGVAGFDESGRGALDDMIWGTTMGFFWPIGCVIWGTRETGIFSPRRKIAVVIGLVLNLGLGFVKWGG